MQLKKLLTVLFFVLTADLYGQELKRHSNGLIYSDTAMTMLKHIVDSINIRYRQSDFWKEYYALPQAPGYYIMLDSSYNLEQIERNMKNGIAFNDLFYRYGIDPKKAEPYLILKTMYSDKYGGSVDFQTLNVRHSSYSISLKDTSMYYANYDKRWIVELHERSPYNKPYLEAFYIEKDFEQKPLIAEYVNMIQYVDCMMDTSTNIFFENEYSASDDPKLIIPKLSAFFIALNKGNPNPRPPSSALFERDQNLYDIEYKNYSQALNDWFLRRDSMLPILLKIPHVRNMLDSAIAEAVDKNVSTEFLEQIAEKFYPKDIQLALKRSRVVIGKCGTDNRPRLHALKIALLAAETANWEVFLRAHLSIMNGQFEEWSDGTEARRIYIRELDQLEFDMPKLLLGISLDISNPSGTHYSGPIAVTGYAISESNYRNEIDATLLKMISDQRLDDKNRMNMYYLYHYYSSCLNGEEKTNARVKLKRAVSTFPKHLYTSMLSY